MRSKESIITSLKDLRGYSLEYQLPFILTSLIEVLIDLRSVLQERTHKKSEGRE